MAHIWWVTSHIGISHVTHNTEVMVHVRMRHATHRDQARHIYECNILMQMSLMILHMSRIPMQMSPIFPQRAQYFCKWILHVRKWRMYSCTCTWPLYYWKWPIYFCKWVFWFLFCCSGCCCYCCIPNQMRRTNEYTTPHVQLRCTYISHTTYERVMSHHMNEAYHITRMSHVTYE